jgi:hypothetical protein
VHGWWFGNPLMEVAPSADLVASARELAEQGATPGSVFLQLRASDAPPTLRLALLLPLEAPAEALVRAATEGLAELASSRFGVAAEVSGPGVVRLGASAEHARITLLEAPGACLLTVEVPTARLQTASDPFSALRTGEALLAAWLRHLNLRYLDLTPAREEGVGM